MTVAAASPAAPEAPSGVTPVEGVRIPAPFRFATAAAWHESLGGVPLERIRFDPPPGSATIEQALGITERERSVELVNGTLVEKAMGAWESNVAMRLSHALMSFADEHRLGVIFGPDATLRMLGGNMRMPVASFVARDRVPTDDAPVPLLCPDLIAEVLSRKNTKAEIDTKLAEFFGGGTRLAWVIDPRKRTVAVYRVPTAPSIVLDAAGQLDGEGVLPGFRHPVAELFRDLPPVS